MTNLDSILKSRDITFPTKVHLVRAVVFSNSHVWMWDLDYKESWVPKNWCFCIVLMEKTLESPFGCKKIQPVHPKYPLEGLMLKLKLQYFGHLMRATDSLEKTPMQEEKGTREDEMIGWHHWLNGHEFEWVPGVGDGQGSLAFGSPWGCKESDTTVRLNWTDRTARGILVPSPRIELMPSAVEVQSLSHWTASDVSGRCPF